MIEVDGGQHDEDAALDAYRTEFLEGEGYRVLRFWNNEVMGNIDGVLSTILERLESAHPLPCGAGRSPGPALVAPHPAGGRGLA